MKLTALLVSTILFASQIVAQTDDFSLNEANSQLIQEAFLDLPDSIEFSIAIIQGDKTNYIGFQKINGEVIQIENSHTGFEIGSITKTFTGLLYSQLLLDKRIKPNRKLSKDLPDAKILKQVTYQNLANHTSGFGRLPDNFIFKPPNNPYKNYPVAKLAEFCQNKDQLAFEPGSQFLYSNTGFALLALALTKVMEQDYPIALQEQIFSKYEMTQTGVDREELNISLAIPRDELGTESNYWDFWGIFGFGDIYSNVHDLSNYVRSYFDPNNLAQNRMLQPTFTINETTNIGISWFQLHHLSETPVFFHDGGTQGFTSALSFEPKSKTAVIFLSNISPLHKSAGRLSNISNQLIENVLP